MILELPKYIGALQDKYFPWPLLTLLLHFFHYTTSQSPWTAFVSPDSFASILALSSPTYDTIFPYLRASSHLTTKKPLWTWMILKPLVSFHIFFNLSFIKWWAIFLPKNFMTSAFFQGLHTSWKSFLPIVNFGSNQFHPSRENFISPFSIRLTPSFIVVAPFFQWEYPIMTV